MTYLNRPTVSWAAGRGAQLLALAGMLTALAACGGASSNGTSSQAASPADISPPAPSASYGVPVASTQVVINNFAFAAQAITVKVGTQVTWTNKDADAHTVTFDADGTGSAGFQNGETYKHTFASVGTFKYHCSLHPYMVGEVLVTSA